LHLTQESILFLGKDSNQSLAHPLKKKGIGVLMKSLLFVLVNSHNLVFSGLLILAKLKQTDKQKITTIKGTIFSIFYIKKQTK
jgi:hypothetical protein